MDSTDVQAVFDRILEDEPPYGRGSADVFALAHRIRRRHTMMMASAGIATAAMVISGVFAVTSGGLGGRGAVPAVPVMAGAQPSAVIAPDNSTPPQAVRTMTDAHNVLAALVRLLPVGSTISPYASGQGFATVRLKDSTGSVLVQVDVQPNFVKEPGDDYLAIFDCAIRAGGRPVAGATCHDTKLSTGTTVVTVDGKPESPVLAKAGVQERDVDTLGADNLRISLREWNAAQPKAGPVTRASLTLSLAQLQAIALSPAWRQ